MFIYFNNYINKINKYSYNTINSTYMPKKSNSDNKTKVSSNNRFKKYEGKGISGLANLGNTCFINTCMQLLSHTYLLNEVLDNKTIDSTKIERRFLNEWNKLRTMLWSKNCVIGPGAWVRAVQLIARVKDRDIFTGYAQNDINEYLLFIFDMFHEALKREVKMTITGVTENSKDKMAKKCYTMIQNMYSKEYSEIIKIFSGIHVSHIISCKNSAVLSMTPEPFMVLELPIKKADIENVDINSKINIDLYDCLDSFIGDEILDDDNMWLNETTGNKERVKKNIRFWNFPDVLIISLKRFNNSGRKIQKFVDFPIENLDLRKYVNGYKKNEYLYSLYGVANHTGGTMGGHYFAYIKNANGKWYNFNDTNISEMKISDVISPKAYLLFYIKKNIA